MENNAEEERSHSPPPNLYPPGAYIERFVNIEHEYTQQTDTIFNAIRNLTTVA